MYPTEASMKGVASDIKINTQDEIDAIHAEFPSGKYPPEVNEYLRKLRGGVYKDESAPGAGSPSSGVGWFPDYSKAPTGSIDPRLGEAQGVGVVNGVADGVKSAADILADPVGFLKGAGRNIAVVIGGVLLVGAAIFIASRPENIAAVKGAVKGAV